MLKLEKIHKDGRGEIYLIKGDLKEHEEITLFITKKGFARGGCIHKKNNEFCVVLEGTIKHVIKDNVKILQKGESIKVPRNTPHYFVGAIDSIVLEWGATPEEKKEKHKEFRKIVDEINKRKLSRKET